MTARKQITITQVARAAGVSTQTVSRVINERPDVAPETRLRVQNVIEQLDYRPNVLARSLIHRRSHTIGVVAMSSGFYGTSTTLVGIEKMTRHLGYSLLLDFMHHPESDDVDRIINRLLSHQVYGILWAVPEIGNNRAWLEKKGAFLPIPVIYLSMQPIDRLLVASIDNYLGGRLATEHLLAQGYRRVGIITGPLDWWETRQRLAGWRTALEDTGCPSRASGVAGDWSAASGAAGIHGSSSRTGCCVACNDQMAWAPCKPPITRKRLQDLAWSALTIS
jgi:LacI family transcriptional regulator